MPNEIADKARTAIEALQKQVDAEFTEEMLELLLKCMGLALFLNGKYRRNIEDFSGSYLFKGKDDSFLVAVVFGNGEMKVHKYSIDNPSITIFFRNPAALRNILFSPKPDILNAILRQDVTVDGNLNYLYKFAYMANHLRLKAQELIP